MPEIIALRCPVCGAPIGDDASRCSYCGSLVAIKSDLIRLDASQLDRAVVNEHIAKYRAAVRRDPNDEAAHYGLGIAYVNLGLLEEAADELAQAARLVPENPHIQTQLAVVYAELARQGRTNAEADAADRVERALRLDPRNTDALILRADLAGRDGNWAAAIDDLRRAVDAGSASAGAELGAVLARRAAESISAGHWRAGVALLRDAMPLNPTVARPALVGIVRANEALLVSPLLDALHPADIAAPRPAGHPLPPGSAAPSPGRAGLKAFGTLLGIAFAAFVVALIVFGNQPRDSALSTIMALVVLAAFLGMVASPVVGIVVWRRAKARMVNGPAPAAGAASPNRGASRNRHESRKALKVALLAGTVNDPDILVDAAERVARVRDDLEAQRAKGRR